MISEPEYSRTRRKKITKTLNFLDRNVDKPLMKNGFLKKLELLKDELKISKPDMVEIEEFNYLEPTEEISEPKNKFTIVDSNAVQPIKTPKNLKSRFSQGSYFFNLTENHEVLYQLGTQFKNDFVEGKKVFAFTNENSVEDQIKAVIAITSYFDYYKLGNTLVISSHKENKYFSELNEIQVVDVLSPHFKLGFNGMNVINLNDLQLLSREDLVLVFGTLLKEFDAIFLDLPSLNTLTKKYSQLLAVFHFIENLSVVVKKDKSRFTELKGMIKTANNFNLKIKGVIWSDYHPIKKASGSE